MKINKLTASFGKLENETLTFHDGLNVIYAPNESGKSTWCAFIRAMLYGIDTAERTKAGYMPDKLRYAPWSGAAMEGSMELTSDRCDITLTRTTKTKNAPMREFSAVYTGTNVRVEGMTGTNAGEMLTGVSKDVFRRSAFIAQGSVAVSGSPELEKRICSIVSTGDEQTSFTETDEQLRAWQRKRRFNRRGMLPELEERMDRTEKRIDEMKNSAETKAALEQRLNDTRARCAKLEDEVTESRKRQRQESLARLNSGRAELKAASEAHDAAMNEANAARSALRESSFGYTDPFSLRDNVERDVNEMRALDAQSKKKPPVWPSILFIVLAIVCAVLNSVTDVMAFIIASAVFGIAGIVFILRMTGAKRTAADACERRRKLLKEYSAASEKELEARYNDYCALYGEYERASEHESETRCEYDAALERQERLEAQTVAALDFASGDSEAARLSRELAAARASAENLSAEIAGLDGRLAAMGEAMILQSDLDTMRTLHGEIQAEYDAIALAVETLRAADEEIQSRFSPQLGKVAARYMSVVTGGRYTEVMINRDFSAMTRADGDIVAHDAEYLSAGTLDIMYLAVRLAVCELALPDGEPCPLIIDDALVNLDEERTAQAMKLFGEIAKERQVILFTCKK